VERRGFGKAALKYKRVEERRNPTAIMRGNGEPAVRARYKDKEYQAFFGTTANGQSDSVVVLWGSALPLPGLNDSAVDVLSMIIDDPDAVEFLDEAPLVFDDAAFVIMVGGAKPSWA
jgi:hypothetical protein